MAVHEFPQKQTLSFPKASHPQSQSFRTTTPTNFYGSWAYWSVLCIPATQLQTSSPEVFSAGSSSVSWIYRNFWGALQVPLPFCRCHFPFGSQLPRGMWHTQNLLGRQSWGLGLCAHKDFLTFIIQTFILNCPSKHTNIFNRSTSVPTE